MEACPEAWWGPSCDAMATLHELTAPGDSAKTEGLGNTQERTAAAQQNKVTDCQAVNWCSATMWRPPALPHGRIVPCASSGWERMNTQQPVQGTDSGKIPRKRFVLEPGSCSRRRSTVSMIPAGAGGACVARRTWSGQDRRSEGRPGTWLGRQVGRQVGIEAHGAPNSLPASDGNQFQPTACLLVDRLAYRI